MYQAFTMLFSLNNDTLRLFLAKKLFCAGNNPYAFFHVDSYRFFTLLKSPQISQILTDFLLFYPFTFKTPQAVPSRKIWRGL